MIGNPPYVRQEKIKALKPELKKRYTCYTGAADLYVYFYERGLQLLNANGTHTFICSNSWLDVNYGAPLQKYLLDNTAGAVICHSEAEREFESADINTIVSILYNGTPEADSHVRFLTFKTSIGDPNVDEKTSELLLKQISPLSPRKFVNPKSEWFNLDAIIFDALNLTQGERDGVYEAVVNLVESRLRKARSLKGK